MRNAAFVSKAARARISCAKAGAPIRCGWASCARNGKPCRIIRWSSSCAPGANIETINIEVQGSSHERCVYWKTRSFIRLRHRRNEQGVCTLEFELGVSTPAEFISTPNAICQEHGEVDGKGSRRDVARHLFFHHSHAG